MSHLTFVPFECLIEFEGREFTGYFEATYDGDDIVSIEATEKIEHYFDSVTSPGSYKAEVIGEGQEMLECATGCRDSQWSDILCEAADKKREKILTENKSASVGGILKAAISDAHQPAA